MFHFILFICYINRLIYFVIAFSPFFLTLKYWIYLYTQNMYQYTLNMIGYQ